MELFNRCVTPAPKFVPIEFRLIVLLGSGFRVCSFLRRHSVISGLSANLDQHIQGPTEARGCFENAVQLYNCPPGPLSVGSSPEFGSPTPWLVIRIRNKSLVVNADAYWWRNRKDVNETNDWKQNRTNNIAQIYRFVNLSIYECITTRSTHSSETAVTHRAELTLAHVE